VDMIRQPMPADNSIQALNDKYTYNANSTYYYLGVQPVRPSVCFQLAPNSQKDAEKHKTDKMHVLKGRNNHCAKFSPKKIKGHGQGRTALSRQRHNTLALGQYIFLVFIFVRLQEKSNLIQKHHGQICTYLTPMKQIITTRH